MGQCIRLYTVEPECLVLIQSGIYSMIFLILIKALQQTCLMRRLKRWAIWGLGNSSEQHIAKLALGQEIPFADILDEYKTVNNCDKPSE